MTSDAESHDLSVLRRLPDLIGKVNGCRSLSDTLQAVVDGVVDVVGFDVAAVSYVHLDGDFEILAVAGNSAAREQLVGRRRPADAYDWEFSIADQWGDLRFVPHERLPGGRGEGWVPELEALDVPDAWHPQDALFAPLCAATGDLVGVLSVDLPRNRRRPGMLQRDILQVFAAQAGIAIDNARLTERLRASEEAFRVAFERAGSGMALFAFSETGPGRYSRVNRAFCQIVGRSEEELLALRFVDITHPDDRGRGLAALHLAATGGPEVYQVEKRYLHADGSTVWVAVTCSVVPGTADADSYVIVQIEDVDDRRAAREELTHRIGHDHLTGLPNRHTFEARLHAAVHAAHTRQTQGALLFCDLDHFKTVNDTYGHQAGDLVLRRVAQRLTDASRRGDTVARLGGDEFVVLAEHITTLDAQQLADRITQAMAAPITVDQATIQVELSIGIAYLEEHHDPDVLLHTADAHMYQAKQRRGKKR